jgi:ribosome-associated protein
MDPQPPAAAAAAADDPLALRLPGGRIVGSDQLVFRATTSGGPGGQHANKTASRIEVVVRIADLPLEPREVALVYERLATRVTGAGELAASCAEHREQHRNRKVAVRRLERLICDALVVQRRRIPTRMSMGARMRRRDDKQQASRRKRSRGTDWSEDD